MKTISAILIGLLLVAITGLLVERCGFVLQLNSQTSQLEGYIYWRQQHYNNCVCVRKTHIVADLQHYLNNTGTARYDAGEVDNEIGPIFKKAIHNFMFDNTAGQYYTISNLPK